MISWIYVVTYVVDMFSSDSVSALLMTACGAEAGGRQVPAGPVPPLIMSTPDIRHQYSLELSTNLRELSHCLEKAPNRAFFMLNEPTND